MKLYKAAIRYKFITKGKKIIGVDPESRRVKYLPAGEEGEKAMSRLIEHLYNGFGVYMGFEEWVRSGKPVDMKKEGHAL